MKDTFDFSSFVQSGRLYERLHITPLNPELLSALKPFANRYIQWGSDDWGRIVGIVEMIFPHFDEEELQDFLTDDYGGSGLGEYAQELDIRIQGAIPDEEPHQTSDTFAGPKGIGEVIKEILKSKFTK